MMMMSVWTFIYATSALVAMVAAFAANLLASRPHKIGQHLHHLGRWLIGGAAGYSLARVLMVDGAVYVRPETAILLMSVALVIVLAGNGEAKKQRERSSLS